MKKRNVLVVDDEAINHFISRKILENVRLVNKTYCAFNGKEALAILEDHCKGITLFPDLILVDLHMPVMDGIEFLRKFWQIECLNGKQRDVLIAVVSSSENPCDRNEMESLGIQHFIPKPISFEKITQLLKDYLN